MVVVQKVGNLLKEKVSTKKKSRLKQKQPNKNFENDGPGMRGNSIVEDYISLYTDELF